MNSRWIAAFSCLLLVAGCGGNEEDSFVLVPVSGTVMLDGKPLEGATVTFIPSISNKPATDGGDVSGSGGSFSAKYRNRPGLAPGSYKVVVGQPRSGGGSSKAGALPDDITKSPYMAGMALDAARGGPGGKKAEKAWPYGDATSTPLNHEVSAKGDTGLQFDLKTALK